MGAVCLVMLLMLSFRLGDANNGIVYRHIDDVQGSGGSLNTVKSGNMGRLGCGLAALSTGTKSFAVSINGKEEYRCVLSGQQGDLPQGQWSIYQGTTDPDATTITPTCAPFSPPDVYVSFVRRLNGSVSFERNWADYTAGFGDPGGEFWLGLTQLHTITTGATAYRLQVDMEDWDGKTYCAVYSDFSVGAETDNFRLSVSGYNSATSTAGDSLTNVDGMAFTTMDSDNDVFTNNCADVWKGGWWYKACHRGKPTGVYYKPGDAESNTQKGIFWKTLFSDSYSLQKVVWYIY